MFFAGALYIGAGLIALWVNQKSALARTFGKARNIVRALARVDLRLSHHTRPVAAVLRRIRHRPHELGSRSRCDCRMMHRC